MENIERSWPIVRPRDGSSKYPKSKIEQLPYDIHISIFNALQVEDTVSLAITCWVILCFEDDYPPGMLTEEELAEASKAGGLYLWTRGFEYWNKDNGILPPAAMVPWSPDRCIFQEIVKKQLPQVRVIRNLSKKEYIRESGITVGADREEMGITQAILSRICCSHDPSMAYQEDIHCGTWAGDRIDIMCENRHNAILMAESKDPSKAPWKDVTEACVQMLLDIRSAQI
ncbi:hypothetical protein BU17DRAFT_72690 [Hysterangium stoloniferum]|nr:hypothetical protein BU17DRAFT_72690 [Hysterangium stoloniferum]